MFKACLQLSLPEDKKDIPHIWAYQIIDDDFEETGISKCAPDGVAITKLVIEIYGKRNLHIARNIMVVMLWIKDKYHLSLNEQFISNKKFNPYWFQFEKDIKKYLIFS